jgi:CRISPR/Cas system CMR subunit Cmr6 (Cas7 group RAMP superfamily)
MKFIIREENKMIRKKNEMLCKKNEMIREKKNVSQEHIEKKEIRILQKFLQKNVAFSKKKYIEFSQ